MKKNRRGEFGGFFLFLLLLLIAIAAIYIISQNAYPQGKKDKGGDSNTKENVTKEIDTEIDTDKETKKDENIEFGLSPDNDPLLFGNPTGAADSDLNNFLLKKAAYTLSYNSANLTANWVAWHLDLSDLGETGRAGKFLPDDSLPIGCIRIKSSDYNSAVYGFDRGHICPSGDRSRTITENKETFLMTNMMAQAPKCNRKIWKGLEDYERALTRKGKELYIAAGPAGRGGTSKKGYFEAIKIPAGGEITVPKYCWKIILILDAGDGDLFRVTKRTPVIAVFIDNSEDAPNNARWENYIVTVDYIEDKVKADFFAPLDDEIEDKIESKKYYPVIKL